ncbi:hypothetical protein TWF106_010017 [Orbilia oligospora]|uniref:Zn(2)-C6 fungal-type domain-containing protein n=1 Tax=Orbilia oligospora TaxID=2813651 RepID=A0A6G1LXZ0_ORBOL|nr:hypothetical protein TWF106_010017 [Orbilia oligospora]KAF3232452.1 hypothetical protein TWF191_000221 [Orbilia oligospora]KAF3238336.1 hypothetical protein TWF192_010350 [Orbilia oligospora]
MSSQDHPIPRPPGPRKRPAPRGTAAYPRKRAIKACQVCRARRTKCDNLKPSCSFCLKVGAKCIQSPTDLSSFDPASLRILERLDDLEQILRGNSVIPPNIESEESRNTQNSHSPISRKANESTDSISETESDGVSSKLIPGPVEEVLAWPEFRFQLEAPPSMMHFFQTRQSDTFTDGFSPSHVSELEPQIAKVLLDRFFAHTHVKNPVLDEVHTRQLVSRLALHGIDWSPQSCLALLVCALGSLAAPIVGNEDTRYDVTPGSHQYQTAHSFFHAAQKRLGICLTNGDIISTQCLFLSGVYMITIFRPIEAWRLFLQALSNCQTLDFLTRENSNRVVTVPYNTASPSTPHTTLTTTSTDSQTRYGNQTLEQAIYWSAWKSEMEMRSELQPQDFKLPNTQKLTYPPFLPSPPNISDQDTSIDGLTLSEQRGWFFYLSEISLRRLVSRIKREILAFGDLCKEGVDTLSLLSRSVEEYELQAKAWYDALPEAVRFDDLPVTNDICKFVLRGHYNNLFEMIYWPFVDAAVHYGSQGNVPSPNDEVTQEESRFSDLAYKGLEKHVERIRNDGCGYHHRHHGTLPMIRSSTRSALVLMAASFTLAEKRDGTTECNFDSRFSELRMPDGWQEVVYDVVEMNRYWRDEAADVKWRIDILERAFQRAQSYYNGGVEVDGEEICSMSECYRFCNR